MTTATPKTAYGRTFTETTPENVAQALEGATARESRNYDTRETEWVVSSFEHNWSTDERTQRDFEVRQKQDIWVDYTTRERKRGKLVIVNDTLEFGVRGRSKTVSAAQWNPVYDAMAKAIARGHKSKELRYANDRVNSARRRVEHFQEELQQATESLRKSLDRVDELAIEREKI